MECEHFKMFFPDANGVVYFQDFVPSVIDRHIKSSRHLPVCILLRETGL